MDISEKPKILEDINTAYQRIKDDILCTPLLKSKWLTKKTGMNIFMKMESEQITGSFKLRGATNKIYKLYHSDKSRYSKEPIITASSGNHGIACSHVVEKLGAGLNVYVGNDIALTKQEKIKEYSNVEVFKYGSECCEAETYARQEALSKNLTYISPYNDIDVIYGQSTIALEILSQLKNVDTILVPVGGGGLIGGIALYAKLMNPLIKIIGCQPQNDASMYRCIKAGEIIDDKDVSPTISNGTAGNVEAGSVTFPICQQYVDEWILLSEDEIEKAVYDMFVKEKKLIEGAAGLCIAGIQKLSDSFKSRDFKNVVIIICGCSISSNDIKQILDKYD